MTLRRATLLLLAVILMTGTGLHAQRRVLPPGAAVVGQVVDAHTGRGLDRVIVEIDGSGLRRRLVTDDRGRFLFTGLPEGDYELHASRNGYLNGSFGQRRPAGESSTISLAYGQWISNANISLWRPAVITGFVTDDAGSPIIGVTVRAFRHDRRAGHAALREASRAVTDDTGAYRLSVLTPGDHLVGISMFRPPDQPDQNVDQTDVDEVVFGPMYYPAADLVAGASIVQAESGRDFVGIKFTLPSSTPREVRGRIDPASVPDGALSAVRVLLARPRDAFVAEAPVHRILSLTVLDADGGFLFTDVPAGQFVIEAMLSGARPVSEQRGTPPTTGPALYWAEQPISVGREHINVDTMSLQSGISVVGRTRMASPRPQPLPPLKMALEFEPLFESAGVKPFYFSATPEGLFETGPALVPGRYLVRVLGVPPGWRLRAVMSGGVDVSDEGLDLSLGFPPMDLSVELTDQLTAVTGTVRGTGPIADATSTVLLFPQGSPRMAARRYLSARTSRDGTFTFRNIPEGAYLIAAVDDAESGGWQAPERLQLLATRATPFLLREGEAKVLELRLVRGR